MEIVVDIPDAIYKRIAESPKCASCLNAFEDRDIFIKAIQNGTPLPKTHGRLIDAEALNDMFLHSFYVCTLAYTDRRGYRMRDMEITENLMNAPTIIEKKGE